MTQRNFDSNYQHDEPAKLSADSPSLPPREELTATEQLIRPDRQFTYWGLPPDQWPPPPLIVCSITVDRLHSTVDGPPHRFLIRIGDDVEVRFEATEPQAHLETTFVYKGCVADIDYLKQQALVYLRGMGMRWVPKEIVYPAPWSTLKEEDCVNPLDPTRQKRQLAEYDGESLTPFHLHPVPKTFSFEEFPTLLARMEKGKLSYVEYRNQFERIYDNREAVINELKERFKAHQLARLATAFGASSSKRATKDANAVSIYRAMLRTFVLEDTFSHSATESFEEAVAKKVRATTAKERYEHYWRKSIEIDERD